MCTCNNCNEITLFKGTNGVGVSSTVDNEDGTFTIYYTDGTSFTSEDLTGPQGATGSTGATGAAGINAFKFIKDFTSNLDGGTCTISRDELQSCFNVPNGCLFESVAAGFTNLQVQVWLRNNEPSPSGNWSLALHGDTLTSIVIDNSTGLITVTLGGGSTNVLVRVVVIA
jgi:DNA/RNA endonuclease YhcR with UshA esterase domain